jgi:hypothetical protein
MHSQLISHIKAFQNEVSKMGKCKKLLIGCMVAVITCVMWLVSACTQSGTEFAPIQRVKTSGHAGLNTTKTTESASSDNTVNLNAPTTSPPPVDINTFGLDVSGLVHTPLSLSYAQIQSLPSVTVSVEIVCPGTLDEWDNWTGVPLSTLLNSAGLSPEAGEVILRGIDGYFVQLPLATVMDRGVILAYRMNGLSLSPDRGYPLRLVVGGSEGSDWLRWVTAIEVKPGLTSFTNSSAAIQNLRINIPSSGSKLCSCFLSVAIVNYQIAEDTESKTGQNNS